MANDTSSSDSESIRNIERDRRRIVPLLHQQIPSRFSVGSVDQRDLERAMAHLQETLEDHVQKEVKAVVHRGADTIPQVQKYQFPNKKDKYFSMKSFYLQSRVTSPEETISPGIPSSLVLDLPNTPSLRIHPPLAVRCPLWAPTIP